MFKTSQTNRRTTRLGAVLTVAVLLGSAAPMVSATVATAAPVAVTSIRPDINGLTNGANDIMAAARIVANSSYSHATRMAAVQDGRNALNDLDGYMSGISATAWAQNKATFESYVRNGQLALAGGRLYNTATTLFDMIDAYKRGEAMGEFFA